MLSPGPNEPFIDRQIDKLARAVAFPASLLSTLLGCRDPHKLNGSKQAPAALAAASGRNKGWVKKPGTDTEKLGKPIRGPGPTSYPSPKADGGIDGTARHLRTRLEEVLAGRWALTEKLSLRRCGGEESRAKASMPLPKVSGFAGRLDHSRIQIRRQWFEGS